MRIKKKIIKHEETTNSHKRIDPDPWLRAKGLPREWGQPQCERAISKRCRFASRFRLESGPEIDMQATFSLGHGEHHHSIVRTDARLRSEKFAANGNATRDQRASATARERADTSVTIST